MDQELFIRSYQAFVSELQRAGFEMRSSRLGNGTWAVAVNPRPLLTIRTRYEGQGHVLVVEARRSFRWRERLHRTVDSENVDVVAADAVRAHRP